MSHRPLLDAKHFAEESPEVARCILSQRALLKVLP